MCVLIGIASLCSRVSRSADRMSRIKERRGRMRILSHSSDVIESVALSAVLSIVSEVLMLSHRGSVSFVDKLEIDTDWWLGGSGANIARSDGSNIGMPDGLERRT